MGPKALNDFNASLAILRGNSELFKSGNHHVYRVIATELRKLLCDRENSLLPRIYKDIRLHRLQVSALLEKQASLAVGLSHIMPGRLTRKDGVPAFELLFANPPETIPVELWMDQVLFSPAITVRELVKSVADKEAAHADPTYNATLEHAMEHKYYEYDSHILTVVAIAQCLLV